MSEGDPLFGHAMRASERLHGTLARAAAAMAATTGAAATPRREGRWAGRLEAAAAVLPRHAVPSRVEVQQESRPVPLLPAGEGHGEERTGAAPSFTRPLAGEGGEQRRVMPAAEDLPMRRRPIAPLQLPLGVRPAALIAPPTPVAKAEPIPTPPPPPAAPSPPPPPPLPDAGVAFAPTTIAASSSPDPPAPRSPGSVPCETPALPLPAAPVDETRLARWLADHLASETRRPARGATGFDARLSPGWPGTLQGPWGWGG